MGVTQLKGGQIGPLDLTTEVSGALPIGNGGTGQTSVSAAMAALLPDQTGNGGKVLSTDGAGTLSWIAAGGGSTDPEVVRDTIAAALVADTVNTGIIITPNDVADTITIGFDDTVGPNIIRQRIHALVAKAGGNAFDSVGWIGGSVSGTLTAAAKSITNKQTRARRTESLVTVAATTAIAGYRLASADLVRGNAAGVGGFYYMTRFGPATGCSNSSYRLFVGLRNTTSARTDTEPSADVNVIGVGADSADTNFQMLCNDGTSTCTKTDTGIALPTADRTGWYQLELWCAANDTTFYYRFTDLTSGTVVSGNFGTTNIPSASTYLSEHWTMSVGGVSSVVGIAIGGAYAVVTEDGA